jgi:hypothetical protein
MAAELVVVEAPPLFEVVLEPEFELDAEFDPGFEAAVVAAFGFAALTSVA